MYVPISLHILIYHFSIHFLLFLHITINPRTTLLHHYKVLTTNIINNTLEAPRNLCDIKRFQIFLNVVKRLTIHRLSATRPIFLIAITRASLTKVSFPTVSACSRYLHFILFLCLHHRRQINYASF